MTKTRVYIAGPITGLLHANIEEFRMVEKLLTQGEGVEVVVPHDLFKDLDTSNFQHKDYMDVCLPALAKCDVAVFLAFWQKSKGAKQEFDFATDNGIIIKQAYEILPEYKDYVLTKIANS